MMAPILLCTLLAALAAWAWFDRLAYRRFAAAQEPAVRLACLHRWTIEAFGLLGCGSLAALALLDRLDAVVVVPIEFEPVRSAVSVVAARAAGGGLLWGMLPGAFIGVAIAVVLGRRRAGADSAAPRPADPMLPRNARERGALVLLSINAGFSEELFFRLVLPLLAIAATGNAWLGIAIALIAFGLMHAYQGWLGIAVTTLIGAVFWAVYLASGVLWLAMLVHAAWDIVVLVSRATPTTGAQPLT